MPQFTYFVAASALFTFAACDAQVDGDHQGDVLATITGSLTSVRAQPLAEPEVAIVWAKRSMMHGLSGAERVAAEGLFPQFQLSIHSPPPADILDQMPETEGESYGVGFVVVGTEGTDYTVRTDWYGIDYDRVVIYLPEDTRPQRGLEGLLHGSQGAGFHVYRVYRLTEDERQERLACVNRIIQEGGQGSQFLPLFESYSQCGGLGNDEFYPIATDLETPFEAQIVEDADILDLYNKTPRW